MLPVCYANALYRMKNLSFLFNLLQLRWVINFQKPNVTNYKHQWVYGLRVYRKLIIWCTNIFICRINNNICSQFFITWTDMKNYPINYWIKLWNFSSDKRNNRQKCNYLSLKRDNEVETKLWLSKLPNVMYNESGKLYSLIIRATWLKSRHIE